MTPNRAVEADVITATSAKVIFFVDRSGKFVFHYPGNRNNQ
jgi:hypothetical protein